MAEGFYERRLFLPPGSPFRELLLRAGVILSCVLLIWAILMAQRDGLTDNRGGTPGPLDIAYFTIVTVTSLGYGDIVAASDAARFTITFIVTPIRLLIWFIFITAAYDLFIRRWADQYRLKQLQKRMDHNTIICGFGVKGRAAAAELLERGTPPDRVIVIERSPAALEVANDMGLTGIRGDAASERVLMDAGIQKAAHVIVVPNQDDACVLICLTIRDLNPKINIVAAARENENVRLIYRSGANTVVAPSVAGGRLLAASTESPMSASMLEEFLTHEHGAQISDCIVTKMEAGKLAREVAEERRSVVLSIRSAGKRIPFSEAQDTAVQRGDVLVLLRPPDPTFGQTPDRL